MSEAHTTDTTSSRPVELGDLSTQSMEKEQQAMAGASQPGTTQEPLQSGLDPTSEAQDRSPAGSEPSTQPKPASSSALPPMVLPAPALTRTETEAIGPSTDLPTPMLAPAASALAQGPIMSFTLLLASTGTRHKYDISERYLTKRNVKAEGAEGRFDPSVISVYTLKELIHKDWREDWDARPSSPSAIRLISFGRMLDDKQSLKDSRLNMDGSPNVLHVSIKPQESMDDDDAVKGVKGSMSRDRDGAERTPGCRCVIL